MFQTVSLSIIHTLYRAIGIHHTGYADCLLASSQHQAISITCMYCCVLC